MPGFDGTGPMGRGPMTGGGRGYCAIPMDSGAGELPNRGFYGGRGAGRGRRNRFYATGMPGWLRAQRGIQAFGGFGRAASKEGELEMLKGQAEFLKQQLEDAEARIKSLEGANDGQ